MVWVDPWVGLGWVGLDWIGLGRLVEIFQFLVGWLNLLVVLDWVGLGPNFSTCNALGCVRSVS